ncbi:MAG: transposase, partial [Candidatus Acidiferrum sp.]
AILNTFTKHVVSRFSPQFATASHHPRQSLRAQNSSGPRVPPQHPRVRFHFTPTYSSWLNQVEIWFAKIEREVIARGIFTSVSDWARKLRR